MNILIFMTDQQSHDTLACGGNSYVQTPTYDRLARDGMRFTQAVCAATPCVPSRFAMFSGFYASQTGVVSNSYLYQDENCIPSFGHLCREHGLRTGAFGKLHFIPYHADVERQDYFGFDKRIGHFYETGEKMDGCYPHTFPEEFRALRQEYSDAGMSKGGDSCLQDMLGHKSKFSSEHFPDWWCAQEAATFISESVEQGFAAVVSAIAPHAPHVVPSDFTDICRPEQIELPPEADESLSPGPLDKVTKEQLAEGMANYYNRVSFVDACHGQVLEALDNAGLYDDTLIIYCSDHGEMLGSRGHSAFSKYCLYEQAIRVPLIIKPPKNMLANKKVEQLCHAPVSLIDILPTIYDMLGVNNDLFNDFAGHSLKPVLLGESSNANRLATLTEHFHWKEDGNLALRNAHTKLIIHDDGTEEFYLLDVDPHELDNRINDNTCKEQIDHLKDALQSTEARMHKEFIKAHDKFETREWSTFQTT